MIKGKNNKQELNPEQQTIKIMKQERIDFVATLPCDRTKNLLPLALQSFNSIELTREEDGLGICAGAYLAGAHPLMIIQSTGLGNMFNALASLNIASAIPVPVIASWRGVYKEGIDSQIPFGMHLPDMLKAGGICYTIIDKIENIGHLSAVIQDAYDHCRPHIALISPAIWEDSSCRAWKGNPPLTIQTRKSRDVNPLSSIVQPQMTRHEAILSLKKTLDDQIVVTNLGIPAKELCAVNDRELNYYMLGSMGLASSIGFGIARFTDKKVMVLEGDGSILMNPNAMITIGQYQPHNLMIIALDNACYGSTGSQRTYTQNRMDLEYFARSCGIENTVRIHTSGDLDDAVHDFERQGKLSFIHAILKPGNTICPNIPLKPKDITKRFKSCLES